MIAANLDTINTPSTISDSTQSLQTIERCDTLWVESDKWQKGEEIVEFPLTARVLNV